MNALELADELEDEHYPWPRFPAAAELRRLHQFAEDQIGRATAAEAALQMTKTTHALKIAAVEAQRDALLEALKKIAAIENKPVGLDWEEIEEARGIATAAIKAVEEET